VEGYIDALALVEAGHRHAVASLGPPWSAGQLRLARRFAPGCCVLDGDRAGRTQRCAPSRFVGRLGMGLGSFLPMGPILTPSSGPNGIAATRSCSTGSALADFFMQPTTGLPGRDATVPQLVAQRRKSPRDQWRQRSGAVQPACKKAAHCWTSTRTFFAKFAPNRGKRSRAKDQRPRSERQRTITTKRR